MTTTNEMTESMVRALVLLMRNGAVFAGGGNEWANGCLVRVPSASIEGLARRGYCDTALSPDGGLMGVPPRALPSEAYVKRFKIRQAARIRT